MFTTRRRIMGTGVAGAGLVTLARPRLLRAQASGANEVKAVMHGDLRVLDPIWTTANITAYYGAMIYDTLFGIDGNFKPQPQMVGDYGISDDQLTYTFELRDGLKFHDGADVTADDCVASILRWKEKDGAGQHMWKRVKDLSAKDEKTIVLTLSEPYGLVLDALAKTSTPLCWIMPKRVAETDPNEQITSHIGSGPFLFNADETLMGQRYVFDKNPNYVPREGDPSGVAGGKTVHLDRVIWENIADEQTAMAALQAGEIDFYETPPIDFLPMLEGDPNIATQVLNELGNVGMMRLNFLHPPFDKVEARRAMLYLLDQEDFMRATFGNPEYWNTCASYLACGTPMESDVATDWFDQAPDVDKAKELFEAAGYDGRPIYLLQATNVAFMNNAAQITAERLRAAGLNVQMEASDWGGVVTRRAVKAKPEEGGWNIFITWAGGNAVASPISLFAHAAIGGDGWFGWPSNERHEELRDEWAAAPDLQERQEVAEEMQKNAWDFVPHVYLGQWVAPIAHRRTLQDIIGIPGVVPFWGMKKNEA